MTRRELDELAGLLDRLVVEHELSHFNREVIGSAAWIVRLTRPSG